MTLAASCLYLLLVVLLGYAVVSAVLPGRRLPVITLAGLSAALGAGAMALLLFWISLLGFAPSRPELALIAFVTLAVLAIQYRLKRNARLELWPADWRRCDFWIAVPAGLAILAVGLVAGSALSSPPVDWDAFAIWDLKAKVLALQPLHPAPPYFHDLTFSYSHLDYPLLVPFLTAGAYAAMGAIDDQSGKLVSVFLDSLLPLILYSGLRWKLGRLPSAFLSIVPLLLPVMFRLAGGGCADLPLTLFYAGSILFIARWLELQKAEDLVLAILFSSFATFTKNEGLILAMLNGGVMACFSLKRGRRRIRLGTLAFFAGWFAVSAAWLIWNRHLPRTHEDYGSKLLSPLIFTRLARLEQVLPTMLFRITDARTWGLLWLLVAGTAALGWRAFARPAVLALWILLALHLAVYALVYCVTPWDLDELIAVSLDRLLWHTLPAVIFLAGWHWAEIESGARSAKPLAIAPSA